MKNILVPYDFSEHSAYALDFAFQVAKHAKGTITILHVIEHLVDDSFNTYGVVGKEDQSEKIYMTELIKKTISEINSITNNTKYAAVEIHSKVRIGNPFDSISKEVTDSQAELIVMGTKGSSGLEEFFVGSNAEKVVRFAKCPVITVPSSIDFDAIKSIGFAINFEDEQKHVIELLKTYQKIFGAKINLVWVNTLHIIENDQTVIERLELFAKKYGIENYSTHTYNAITPEHGILNFAFHEKIDMIALATHGFKGLAHLFLGSVAEDIVNHATIPVWTYSLKNLK